MQLRTRTPRPRVAPQQVQVERQPRLAEPRSANQDLGTGDLDLMLAFEEFPNLFKVLAQDFFFAHVSENVRRMHSCHCLGAPIVHQSSMDFGDSFFDPKHSSRGRRAKAADEPRLNRCDLTEKKWRACTYFVCFRGPVARRAAFDDVADVHIFPPDADQLQHAIQELTRSPDKRQSLFIFVRSRPFTDEDQLGPRISLPENYVFPPTPQLAPVAVTQIVTNLLEGFRSGRRPGGSCFKQA
jgi:hypothetical protein